MMLLLGFLNFYCALSTAYFNETTIKTLEPDGYYTHSESAFGHSMHYSAEDKSIYVAAPNSKKGQNENVEVGAVFRCRLDYDERCIKYFSIPNEAKYSSPRRGIRALFGISFKENFNRTMLVCGSNAPFFQSAPYYCFNNYKSNGILVSDVSFPSLRVVDNKIYVDNYGMLLENYDKVTTPNPRFLIGQINEVYYDIEQYPQGQYPFLMIQSQQSQPQYLPLKSVPSYSVLVNPDSNKNRVIVFYNKANQLIGMIDVFDDQHQAHQTINVLFGSAGQQFGFSSALGRFNTNNCLNFVVTAPLYSKLSDEGVAFVYSCDPLLNRFDETPTLLFGESTPNARFGIAVANLKDINHDGYDDLAVLAPNWYEESPHIFVYVSGPGSFSQIFAQKIIVEKFQQPSGALSYGLISQFDINKDGVDDIAISFPNNNKVIILSGIHFTEITALFNYSLNTSIPEPQYGCYPKSGIDVCGMFLLYSTQTIIQLHHATNEDLAYQISLDYNISLEGREGSNFLISNKFETSYIYYVNYTPGLVRVVITIPLYLLFIPDSSYNPIAINIRVWPKIGDLSCGVKCINPDPVDVTKYIYPTFLTCTSESCLPSLEITSSPVDPLMLVGTTHKRKLEIRLTHTGKINSYFTRLEIRAPKFSKITDAKFINVNPNEIVHNTFENKTTETNHFFYTIQRLMTSNDEITCEIDIEISPPIGAGNFVINLVADDPMYKNFKPQTYSIPISLPEGSIIGFSGESFPPTVVVIGERNESSISNKEDLVYVLNIYNNFTEESLKNVIVLLNIPFVYTDVVILSLMQIIYPNSFLPIDCSSINVRDCGENTVALVASTMDPTAIAEIKVELRLLDTFDILAKKNEKYIKLDAAVYFDGVSGQLKQEISVITYLTYPPKKDTKKLIWPIVVAIICAIIILSLLGYIIYRYKLVEKIKERIGAR